MAQTQHAGMNAWAQARPHACVHISMHNTSNAQTCMYTCAWTHTHTHTLRHPECTPHTETIHHDLPVAVSIFCTVDIETGSGCGSWRVKMAGSMALLRFVKAENDGKLKMKTAYYTFYQIKLHNQIITSHAGIRITQYLLQGGLTDQLGDNVHPAPAGHWLGETPML